MANTVQIKRGNSTSVNSHTGPSGEIIYNLDTGRIHAQDGVTAGGHPHALVRDVNFKANASVNIIAGAGTVGGGDLSADRTIALSHASLLSLAKADTAVQPAITITAGTGLTGGGNLTANRTVALNAASIASLGKADTALQAPGGATGQILAKSSNTTNDVVWVSSGSATAVSYGPQTLTEEQQGQARQNIQADKSYDSIASVAAATVPAFANAIRTNGYYAAGDGGGALYKRVSSEPSHAGKVQSADGAWWELSEDTQDLRAMGVKFDGVWGLGDIYTGTDNTDAINAAFAFKPDWIAPAGICLTRGGHVVSGSLNGAGIWSTTFMSINNDPSVRIFTLHTLARIDKFRMMFNGDIDLSSANEGDFVGLQLGVSGLTLCKGGGYGNIAIGRCGTAIWSGVEATFACRFDNIEIREFHYRAIDVTSGLRTPNYWGNIYASGLPDRTDCDVVINLSGDFSDGDHFGVVHIEQVNANAAIRISGSTGVKFDVLHLEDFNQIATERCFFEHREGASAHYGRVSIWYSVLKDNGSFFGGFSSKRQGSTSARLIDQDAFIKVDHLELCGLYSDEARTLPVYTVSGFKFFQNYTGEGSGGVWYASVNNYTWYSYNNSTDDLWYSSPNLDDANMRIERFGNLRMPDELKSVRALTESGKLGRLDNVIIVNAASGDVVITLPKTISGKTREILIRRVDSSGNTVSYAAQSGDTVNVANTPPLGTTRIISDGYSNWLGV